MAVGFYYISYIDPKTKEAAVLSLSATVSSRRELKSSIAEHLMADGEASSDNVVNEGEVVVMTGEISDLDKDMKTDEFIQKITDLRASKQPFDVVAGDLTAVSNNVSNCLFTSISFEQTKQKGIASRRIKAYKVSLSFKQVRLASTGTLGEIKVPGEEVKDVVEPKKKKSSSTVVTGINGQFAAFNVPMA